MDGITWNVNTCAGTGGPPCWGDQQTNPVTNYSGSYGKVIAQREYDWGQGAPGPLLRQTKTSYLWQSNGSYLSANLLDLPSSVVIQDGNSNRVAETDYTYDESQYLSASNISTQHGAAPNAVRGNLTTVSKWLNTSSNPIVTHTNWYDTGEVYQAIDPLGNTTTHSYSSSFAGAYPTQTCNALSQCVSGNYDFDTGLLTSLTDANRQISNYSYDNRWRITEALFPADPAGNHPETDFSYPSPTEVDRSSTVTTGPRNLTSQFFDGVGRPVKLVHTSANNATVVTNYDADGRVASVTNPYYPGDTVYSTSTAYDGLGRVTQTTKQDGSITSAQYDQTSSTSPNGDCTLTTDEAGKQRKSCLDGLGRLIEVDEPQPSSGSMSNPYVTLYSYDALGNLLSVNQKGDGSAPRVRTFTYDSLSRLLTATNPESGQISYSYDANGNVLQKTSPAPNQTGTATQTISYCYDKLNRVTGKAYSAQSCPLSSPVVTYSYDSGANGIGHLTSLSDQAGSGSYSFDALGRIGTEQRTIAGISKTLIYTYDLDGSVATLTYPSGAVVTYTPDAAGRMLSAVDVANNINYVTGSGGPNPSSGATYGPDGSILSFSQGWTTSFAGIANSFSYNQRLQPVTMAATSPGTTGTDATTVVTISGDLSTAQNASFVTAEANSPITNAGQGDFYYLDSGGHVREATLVGADQWGNWLNADITAVAGGPAAITGSQLVGYKDSSGRTYVLHVNSAQHLEALSYSNNAWGAEDLGSTFGGVVAGAGTPIINAGQGDFYYLDNGGHVHEATLLSNGGWASWTDADITALAGGPAAITGSQLVGYKDSSGRTYVLHVNSAQHLEALSYNNNAWGAEDLGSTFGGVVAGAGTPIINAGQGDFYYLDNGGHVHEATLLSNGGWASWTDADITALAGGPAAISGSQLVGYKDSSGRTYVLHVNTAQHLEALSYSNNAWGAEDLGSTFGGVVAGAGTPIVNAGQGDFYYVDNGGHVHEACCFPTAGGQAGRMPTSRRWLERQGQFPEAN